MEENGFILKKKRHEADDMITDEDYANDLSLLENTPAQAESLLHNMEQAARGLGLCVIR